MMNVLNIVLILFNITAAIVLFAVAKRINAKKFKLEVLDTKVKAIQKRLDSERQDLDELKQTLQEQKMVLNQKWDQIQEASQLLDARAMKLDEERQGLAAEQENVTAKKIEIEQQEIKLEQTMLQLKEKWQQHRNEIRAEREQLVKEFERINEAIQYLESLENKVKIENQKADKEKSYLAEQFRALEATRRELEQKSLQLQEKERQLNEMAQQQREGWERLESEREKLKHLRQSMVQQPAELIASNGSNASQQQKSEQARPAGQRRQTPSSAPNIAVPNPNEILEKNIAERWHWVGNLLRDDGRPDELLFGKTLPRIIDPQRWNDVEGIVVGEHADGSDQLLWQLKPEPGASELDLNALEQQQKTNILAQSHNTRFFLAAYNNEQRLIGFQTFRFMPQLHDIEIEHPPMLPNPDGHRPTQIRFAHDPNCDIHPIGFQQNEIIIRKEPEATIAVIPADPKLEATIWEIMDGLGRKLQVTIHIHRIWWSLVADQDLASQAQLSSKPLEISWEQIHSGAVNGISLWLPLEHGLQQLYIGLTKQKRKAFQLKPNDRQVFVSLDGWINPKEIAQLSERIAIQLWLDKRTNESTELAFILPAPWQCKTPDCHFRAFDKTAFYDHIKDHHFDQFFRQADYDEIRKQHDQNLPAQIYQCGYCHQYIAADNNEPNPANVIIQHIFQCTEARQHEGAPFIQFRIVKDSDEIRHNMIPNLPVFLKCKLCQQLFQAHERTLMLEHLFSAHETAIIERSDRSNGQSSASKSNVQPADIGA